MHYYFSRITDSYNFSIIFRKEYVTSKSTIASQKELLFEIKQIGKLHAVDINSGVEYPVIIDLANEIPEIIVASENGKYILFAYSDETATIYKLNYKQIGSSSIILGEFGENIKYKLPEFDQPSFYFIDKTLIFQKQAGRIVKFD